MTFPELFEQMAVAERLKCSLRHSWTSSGRQESVAEHSWRLALLAALVSDAFPGLDRERLLLLCLFHDIGEAFTGDIPAFEKTAAHEAAEQSAVETWLASLPADVRPRLTALWREFEAQESREARLAKALDKMETLIQHNEGVHRHLAPGGVRAELHLRPGPDRRATPTLSALRAAVNQVTPGKNRTSPAGFGIAARRAAYFFLIPSSVGCTAGDRTKPRPHCRAA